jgi:hypothetical protein
MFRFLGPRRPPAAGAAGNGGSFPSYPPARATPREIALQRELDELRSQQAALARAEREAANNLANVQDALDALSTEIDKRARSARDPELRVRGERAIANVKSYLARRSDAGRIFTPATLTSLIRQFVGLERAEGWVRTFLDESAERTSSQRPPQAVQATAQGIVDAGSAARGQRDSIDIRTGRPRPLPSPIATLDPAAKDIIRAGRRARNQPDE